jgi:hypothetical protein
MIQAKKTVIVQSTLRNDGYVSASSGIAELPFLPDLDRAD